LKAARIVIRDGAWGLVPVALAAAVLSWLASA